MPRKELGSLSMVLAPTKKLCCDVPRGSNVKLHYAKLYCRKALAWHRRSRCLDRLLNSSSTRWWGLTSRENYRSCHFDIMKSWFVLRALWNFIASTSSQGAVTWCTLLVIRVPDMVIWKGYWERASWADRCTLAAVANPNGVNVSLNPVFS